MFVVISRLKDGTVVALSEFGPGGLEVLVQLATKDECEGWIAAFDNLGEGEVSEVVAYQFVELEI